jgi:hypothetical protein
LNQEIEELAFIIHETFGRKVEEELCYRSKTGQKELFTTKL